MKKSKTWVAAAVLITGVAFQNGFSTCENAIRLVDPCGTILANCQPGTLALSFVTPGSPEAFALDPYCAVPGACAAGDYPANEFNNPNALLGPNAWFGP